MKSRKRTVAKRAQKSSCLSLDFLKSKKWPVHGTWSGATLMILGSLLAVSLVTFIGLVVFVPSFGTVAWKFLKKNLAIK